MASRDRRNHHRLRGRGRWPHTTLDPDEQGELAVKIRHGIGLEQLVGEQAAHALRRDLPMTSAPGRRPHPPPAVPPPPDPDAQRKAIARLGRGHNLGRTWRR